jgi:hypothetical protein
VFARGMSEYLTEAFFEVFQAIESGLLRPAEPRTAETTTPTTLEEFARDGLKPLVSEPAMAC